jgi:hypothetical protein
LDLGFGAGLGAVDLGDAFFAVFTSPRATTFFAATFTFVGRAAVAVKGFFFPRVGLSLDSLAFLAETVAPRRDEAATALTEDLLRVARAVDFTVDCDRARLERVPLISQILSSKRLKFPQTSDQHR